MAQGAYKPLAWLTLTMKYLSAIQFQPCESVALASCLLTLAALALVWSGFLAAGKFDLVSQLLAAKEASGKTFTQISQEVGLTNAYTAQLFHNQVKSLLGQPEGSASTQASAGLSNATHSVFPLLLAHCDMGDQLTLGSLCGVQAQLKAGREEALRKACPALTDELVAAMKRSPMRGYDPAILKEPHIYRSHLLPCCCTAARARAASHCQGALSCAHLDLPCSWPMLPGRLAAASAC